MSKCFLHHFELVSLRSYLLSLLLCCIPRSMLFASIVIAMIPTVTLIYRYRWFLDARAQQDIFEDKSSDNALTSVAKLVPLSWWPTSPRGRRWRVRGTYRLAYLGLTSCQLSSSRSVPQLATSCRLRREDRVLSPSVSQVPPQLQAPQSLDATLSIRVRDTATIRVPVLQAPSAAAYARVDAHTHVSSGLRALLHRHRHQLEALLAGTSKWLRGRLAVERFRSINYFRANLKTRTDIFI